MFGFFSARAPLTTGQRVDLELLIRRTVDVFGIDFLRSLETVGSLDEFTGGIPSGADSFEFLQTELSRRFGLDPDEVKVSVVDDPILTETFVYHPGTADDLPSIGINSLAADDDLRLVTTLANSLAQHAWTKRADRDLDLDVRTTMLLPIVCGLGVLVADAALYDDQWSTGGWSGWSLSRLGHYNAMEVGYAMACVAKLTGQPKSTWVKRLRLDARSTAKQTLRFFASEQGHGNTRLLDADRIPGNTDDENQLAKWISGSDPDWSLAAVRTVSVRAASVGVAESGGTLSDVVTDACLTAASSGDANVQTAAATAFAFSDPIRVSRPPEPNIESTLRRLSKSRNAATVLASIESATALGLPHQGFVDAADWLLHQESFDQLPVAAWVARGGRECEILQPTICIHLADAIRFEHDVATDALADCLIAISGDAAAVVRKQIRQPELQASVLARLDGRVSKE